MGYQDSPSNPALLQFKAELEQVTSHNHQILNHLLHGAFDQKQPQTESSPSDSALGPVDLILQPEVSDDQARELLQGYHFTDYKNAARNIESLAPESSLFLSSHRSRHFLASIISDLLTKISQTPNPDATLVSLSSIADAIGGKASLWELLNYHSPSLEMFVRLCSSSDYLASIIRRNPGMIDELIDSLLLQNLPTIDWIRSSLDELTTGAQEAHLIVQSFKHVRHLRIGVRDIVALDPIQKTHQALSDVAEVCLAKIADTEFIKQATKHANQPVKQLRLQQQNSLVIIALGKLGGREPNYHSDLDVLFLYDSSESKNVWLNISPQQFYSELAAKITKSVSKVGSAGRLYEIDSRLRPTGGSGALAVSLNEFARYFASGRGQLWERQSLCKARAVYGNPELQTCSMQLIHDIITEVGWQVEMTNQISDMRMKMQNNCRPNNLKRGAGGTVDIEFIVQMLQLQHAKSAPDILVPGTIEAAKALMEIGELGSEDGKFLIDSYQFLRGVEARLRLMNTTARHEMPTGINLAKLAYLLRCSTAELESQVTQFRRRNRILFGKFFNWQ